MPVFEKDAFDYRLHWLVANIPISPKQTQAIGSGSGPADEIMSWLAPHVQLGDPYHRYSMIVFKQAARLDPAALKAKNGVRDGFKMRSFKDANNLEAIGAFLWRGKWDENTAQVMKDNNLPGWDKMLVRKKDEKNI